MNEYYFFEELAVKIMRSFTELVKRDNKYDTDMAMNICDLRHFDYDFHPDCCLIVLLFMRDIACVSRV